MLRRVCCSITYDGRHFLGCSPQPSDNLGGHPPPSTSPLPTPPVRSIHWYLTKSLTSLLNSPSHHKSLSFSSRTDRSVSALLNTVQFDLLHPTFPLRSLVPGWNHHLSLMTPHLAVMQCLQVPKGWSARSSAYERTYQYRISYPSPDPDSLYSDSSVSLVYNSRELRQTIISPDPLSTSPILHHPNPLNVSLMVEAASLMVGDYDGRWCRGKKCNSYTHYTTVHDVQVVEVGGGGRGGLKGTEGMEVWGNREGGRREVLVNVRGRSFLKNQVRNMVGLLVAVGEGKMSLEEVEGMVGKLDRRGEGFKCMGGEGLVLKEVRHRFD
ncbi:hypothetical protein TrCOL_g12194 [Triparma columacea]|uniref:tRNA pseudouridine synthase n=1 Tax=Triparma columacea TaxID=722753 RepID=A0A9W7LBA2_9STRA|nr:hypothetical protein TrCOL_g12194 [Triparma columacea]